MNRSVSPSLQKASTRAKRVVRAAGALVWRECRGRLEVLLVHRPRYDDWSFPKGKVERNESVSAREIDGVAWVRVKKARKQLTHAMDRDLLGSLVDLWEDGKLDTWTFVLVRHARAVKRSVWSRHRPKRVRDKEADEATRPLTHDQGEVRARALVPVLAAYGVGRVVSSPWRRCVDTVAPYAEAAGLDVVAEPALTELAHAESRKAARRVVSDVLRRHGGDLPARAGQASALGPRPRSVAENGGDHGGASGAAPARQDSRRGHREAAAGPVRGALTGRSGRDGPETGPAASGETPRSVEFRVEIGSVPVSYTHLTLPTT